MKQRLSEYVHSVMPGVFNTSSIFLSIKNEIQRHHAYFKLIWYSPTEADRLPLLVVSQLLTNLTALMFLLALLYDLQSPPDNGSCPQYTTKETCLEQVSLLDYDQTYCQWTADETTVDENGNAIACVFNPTEINIKIQLYCATIVSIATALLMSPLEKLFTVLDSPTTSKIAPIATSSMPTEDSDVTQVHHQATTVMILPEETQVAYRNARLSTMFLTNVQVVKQHNDDSQQTIAVASIAKDGVFSKVDRKSGSIQNLVDDITYTRKLLQSNTPSSQLLRDFDNAWGIDPRTGDFMKHSLTAKDPSQHCIEECILHELDTVKESVQIMKNDFGYKSEDQAGVKLLQLFILDLLGRDSDAAKIFQVKVHEDYTTLPIVSIWYKVMAAVAVCIINGFFLYYAVLRRYQKGAQWQLLFLRACIIQIMLEIGFSETLQCLYINYFVPRLMSRAAIDKIRQVLQDCIDHLCKSSSTSAKLEMNQLQQQQQELFLTPTIVDAPSYLFVSTQIAKAFPTMMESMMVLSYHSIMPGEIGKKWLNHNQHDISGVQHNQHDESLLSLINIKKALTILNTWLILSVVKFMTSAPIPLQKFTIRFMEPLILGSVAFIWYYIVHSSVGIALFVITVTGVAIYVGYHYFVAAKREKTRQVVPQESNSYDDILHQSQLQLRNQEIKILSTDVAGNMNQQDQPDGEAKNNDGANNEGLESKKVNLPNRLQLKNNSIDDNDNVSTIQSIPSDEFYQQYLIDNDTNDTVSDDGNRHDADEGLFLGDPQHQIDCDVDSSLSSFSVSSESTDSLNSKLATKIDI